MVDKSTSSGVQMTNFANITNRRTANRFGQTSAGEGEHKRDSRSDEGDECCDDSGLAENNSPSNNVNPTSTDSVNLVFSLDSTDLSVWSNPHDPVLDQVNILAAEYAWNVQSIHGCVPF